MEANVNPVALAGSSCDSACCDNDDYRLREGNQSPCGSRESTEPYPDPQRPGCYRVPLASRVHHLEAIIDADALPLVVGKRWNWSPSRGNRQYGTVVLLITGSSIKPPLHQIILGIPRESSRKCRVAHLNGDPLDCRRENLVVRTMSQQRAAGRKASTILGRATSSRFKGVKWSDEGRKWSVAIRVGGRRQNLGRFRNEIDAALAYDAAVRELYGEHALLNIPDTSEIERLRASQATGGQEDGEGGFPPPGFVDMDEACEMFGIPPKAWVVWEQRGRITCAGWFSKPGGGRCKLYPLTELEALREEFSRLGDPYPDPERPGCYRVPLASYVCYREAIIDAESLPLVQGAKWTWVPRDLRSSRGRGNIGDGEVMMQRPIRHGETLARRIAGITGFDVRAIHINGDGLDCRRENLLVRTLQEQIHANRKMTHRNGRPCTSRFKGVHWCEPRGKWVSQIVKEGHHRYLGGFADEIAAAEAYDEAARELFGEHAYLNFPDGIDAYLVRTAA